MVIMTRDGAIIHQDEVTQEQQDLLWSRLFSAFLRENPDLLTGGQEAAEASASPA